MGNKSGRSESDRVASNGIEDFGSIPITNVKLDNSRAVDKDSKDTQELPYCSVGAFSERLEDQDESANEYVESSSHFSDSSSDEDFETSSEANQAVEEAEPEDLNKNNMDSLNEGQIETDRTQECPLDNRTQARMSAERDRWDRNYHRTSERRGPVGALSRLHTVKGVDDISPETSPDAEEIDLEEPHAEERDTEEPNAKKQPMQMLSYLCTQAGRLYSNTDKMSLGAAALEIVTMGIAWFLVAYVGPQTHLYTASGTLTLTLLIVCVLSYVRNPTHISSSERGAASSPTESPVTPSSAGALEFVTGMSMEEGKSKLAELNARAKNIDPNDPKALQIKRQILKYGEHFLRYGRFNDSILSTAEAQQDPELAAIWSSAMAHCYRTDRERYSHELEKRMKENELLRESVIGWKASSERHQASFEAIREDAMITRRAREMHEEGEDETKEYICDLSASDQTSAKLPANDCNSAGPQIELLDVDSSGLESTTETSTTVSANQMLDAAMQTEADTYSMALQESQKHSGVLEHRIQTLQKRNDELQKYNHSLNAENKELQDTMQGFEQVGRKTTDSPADEDQEIHKLRVAIETWPKENEDLRRQNEALTGDVKRATTLLWQYHNFEQEREGASNQLSLPRRPTPASPLLLTPNTCGDGLLSPNPLPSALGPATPSTSVPSVLRKSAHWVERERRIRNTEQFRKNRDAVLEHFAALDAEEQ